MYSNVLRLHPGFELGDVLDDLAEPLSEELAAKVREAVADLQVAFSRAG